LAIVWKALGSQTSKSLVCCFVSEPQITGQKYILRCILRLILLQKLSVLQFQSEQNYDLSLFYYKILSQSLGQKYFLFWNESNTLYFNKSTPRNMIKKNSGDGNRSLGLGWMDEFWRMESSQTTARGPQCATLEERIVGESMLDGNMNWEGDKFI
jgi:hypothetical protein